MVNQHRREFLTNLAAGFAAATASGILVPRYALGQTNDETNLKIQVQPKDTGLTLSGIINDMFEGKVPRREILPYLSVERGKTPKVVTLSALKGAKANLHTDYHWAEGSNYSNSQRKIATVDRSSLSQLQQLDFLFPGDTIVVHAGRMASSNTEGVAAIGKNLLSKYQGKDVIEITADLRKDFGQKNLPFIRKYVDAAEAVYGSNHPAVKDLRQTLSSSPYNVMAKMVTPELVKTGGMYEQLAKGDGAIAIENILSLAERGETRDQNVGTIAPAHAHRVDLTKPAVYVGASYGWIPDPSKAEVRPRSFGVFEGNGRDQYHHVLNQRTDDWRQILGDPALQGIAQKTFPQRKLAPYVGNDAADTRSAQSVHHLLWADRDPETNWQSYNALSGRMSTVGQDLVTITNAVRPGWQQQNPSRPNHHTLYYLAFQLVKPGQ